MPTIAIPQGNLALSTSAPTAVLRCPIFMPGAASLALSSSAIRATSSHALPVVAVDGVQMYWKWTGGTAGAADGQQVFLYFFFTRTSNGSRQTIAKWNGTVPAELYIDSSDILHFDAGTSGAVCANALGTAVTTADGICTALVGLNGNVSTLSCTRQNTTPGTPLTGTNTPGVAANIDFTADLFIAQNGSGGDYWHATHHGAGLGYFYRDATSPAIIAQFVDTTTGIPRLPGTAGANYLDGAVTWAVILKDLAANANNNSGTADDADELGVPDDELTSPAFYAADIVSASYTAVPAVGGLTLAGAVPTLAKSDRKTIAPQAGTLVISGAAPSLRYDYIIAVPQGNLSLAGAAPGTVFGDSPVIEVPQGNLSLVGATPSAALGDSHVIAIPQGALALSSLAPDVTVTTDVVVPPVVSQPRTGAAGSGFTARIDYRERDRIVEEIKEIYADLYRKVEEDSPIAIEVAAAVAKYADDDAADLPAPSDIDWAALAEDGRVAELRLKSALEALERELAALKARRAEQLDDEDDEEMLLMVA